MLFYVASLSDIFYSSSYAVHSRVVPLEGF